MITLVPMTAEEFDTYAERLFEDYAHTRARNLKTTIEEERANAALQHQELLPDGIRTPGQRLWNVVDAQDGDIGQLWVQIRDQSHSAFIYDIEIAPAHQRKGYGRQTLAALEAAVRPLGVVRIELNVFGDNPGAQALYAQTGYQVAATAMLKALT